MWRSKHTRGPADLTPGPTWPLQHPCSCPHPMKEPLAPLRLMGSWHCPHPPLLPLTPLILPWFSFPQVPGVHTFSRPWGRWRPWGTVRSPLVSRPRSILRHQGHLEPASARPSFSTVMNTVLTLRCTPSASLHRPPAPRHWHCLLETRQLTGCRGSCTLTLGSGQGHPWRRPETEPCERWLPVVPWDWVWGTGEERPQG